MAQDTKARALALTALDPLSTPDGFTLIMHKRAGTNTYARTAAQLAAVGGMDDQNIFHWIDPSLDEAIIADTNEVSLIGSLNNAHTDLPSSGGQRLLFPPFRFKTDDSWNISKPGIVLDMRGATLDADLSARSGRQVLGILASADGCIINGGTVQESHNASSSWQLEVQGSNLTINTLLLTKPNRTGGGSSVQMYTRFGCDGLQAYNLWTTKADGIFVQASNLLFVGGGIITETPGGDDGYVFKAPRTVSIPEYIVENVRLVGVYVENASDVVAFGTEIGMAATPDSTHLLAQIRGIEIVGATGKNVGAFMLVKPGDSSSGADYCDGWVHGIRATGTLIDELGSNMYGGVVMRAARGGWITDVEVDLSVYGRAWSDESTGDKDVIDLWTHDYPTASTSSPKIDNINLAVNFMDPYNGVAFGTSGVPGYPFVDLVRVHDTTAAQHCVSRVNIALTGNGCSAIGARINEGIDDYAVSFSHFDITNVNADLNTSTGRAGLNASCKVVLPARYNIQALGGVPATYFTGTGGIAYLGFNSMAHIANLTAAPTASDFNNLLAELQAQGFMS